MTSNLGDILKSSLESIKDLAGAETVIGTPITTPVGTVIIPVSKVSVGIASGGVDYDGKNNAPQGQRKSKNFGGGGGTGITVSPVCFLVVSATGSVEILNVGADMPPAGPVESVANLIEKSPEIISRLKSAVSTFKNTDGKSTDAEDENL